MECGAFGPSFGATKLLQLSFAGQRRCTLHTCPQHTIEYEIISTIENRVLEHGEIYVVLEDRNLIRIIKKISETQLVLAQDIGIISYNDTILKEVVANGITTISTDFNFMGERLAEMILNNEQVKVENPSSLILRKSI